jgi:diadenosine tetraphosphate (Ap4A) HIT family hydrolase
LSAVPDCRICELHANLSDLPVREKVYVDDHWRVSHGWSTLEGWLVVCARQHAQALDDLSPEALECLGPLVGRLTAALRRVVRCERTYLVLFAETPEFRHVHIHVVPRMAWFGEADSGPNVFRFLQAPESAWITKARRDDLATQLSQQLGGGA